MQNWTSTACRSTLWTSLSTSPSSTSSSDTSYELPHACKTALPAAVLFGSTHSHGVCHCWSATCNFCEKSCCYLNEEGQERRKRMRAVLLVVMHPALHQQGAHIRSWMGCCTSTLLNVESSMCRSTTLPCLLRLCIIDTDCCRLPGLPQLLDHCTFASAGIALLWC